MPGEGSFKPIEPVIIEPEIAVPVAPLVLETAPVDITHGMQDPLEQLADMENGTPPAEIPVNGTELSVDYSSRLGTDWDPNDPTKQSRELKERALNAGLNVNEAKPIKGLDALSAAEIFAGIRNEEKDIVKKIETKEESPEVKELTNRVTSLEAKIDGLFKLLEAKKPEPETIKAEIMPEVVPEVEPEVPKEPETFDANFEVIDKKPEVSMLPLEVPLGWGGEPRIKGVGHEASMAAIDAMEEFRQENLSELNKLKEKREGREAVARGSFWERAKALGSRGGRWLTERMKGFISFGAYEFYQGEKVRRTGKNVEKDITSSSQGLKHEVGEGREKLSYDDALEEAEKMKEGGDKTAEQYGELSESISAEKIENNQKLEDEMVAKALETIKTRNGSRTFSGEKVDISGDKLKEIEDNLRRKIRAMRTEQLKADEIKFKEMVRTSIDPKWYKRYVAGGIEAALMSTGTAWLTFGHGAQTIAGLFGGKSGTIGVGKEAVKQVYNIGGAGNPVPSGPTLEAFKEIIPSETDPTKPLTSNLWNMAKQLFVDKGIPNPTDGQIMEVTKQLATDNATKVPEWGMNLGDVSGRVMPRGMLINIGKAALLVGKLAGHATGVL